MAEVIRMPKMSDTMEEGVIAAWLVKEGDIIKSGDILAEVETDKATMELESYEDGVLLHIGVKEQESVPVDGVIAVIGEKGEDFQALLQENLDNSSESTKEPEAVPSEVVPEVTVDPADKIDTSGINATLITMPKMSDTMTDGTITTWLKKIGEEVSAGDILAEVETDKATMELEAYEEGILLYIGAEDGTMVPVDGVIAVIGEKGANFQLLLDAHKQKATEKALEPTTTSPEPTTTSIETVVEPLKATSTATSTSVAGEGGRIKASPLARRLATEKGYDLSKITGSAENGRIVRRDVENYQPEQSTSETVVTVPQDVGQEQSEEVPLSQMRKTIAKRLAESKFSAPHFYVTMEINMDKAIESRKSLNEMSPVKISFNDLIIKATAAAIRQNPGVNISYLGDKIRKYRHIHIGVAVAVEDGLLVPVVRFADNKSLSHIASEVKELAKMAVEKKLQPSHWEGSTFTISNLGMFGVEEFTAIINTPDSCILAVGGIKATAVVKEGQLVPGNVMKVTLSCDHRAVDGATAAAFLRTLKDILEDPVRILI
ncbi:MAG: pyruvate dehydrogenase complex dihydrolipoamide acetyltransferase [Bacteroidetes bacterium]|nr:MAG: pyruvate dehydrogenase complex dihydrolipoamide acetyltransferase [Bacteroidota bacterium]